MLAEADRLRDAVFGDGEVLGGESGDEFALLVFDHDGFDHQLRLDGEECRSPMPSAELFWPICCAPAGAAARVREGGCRHSHLRTSGAT